MSRHAAKGSFPSRAIPSYHSPLRRYLDRCRVVMVLGYHHHDQILPLVIGAVLAHVGPKIQSPFGAFGFEPKNRRKRCRAAVSPCRVYALSICEG
jgi:hypothetical protein